MTLRTDLLSAVAEAFVEVDSLLVSATYRRVAAGTYNPATGQTNTNTDYTVKMAIMPVSDYGGGAAPEARIQDFSGDIVATFQAASLAIEPQTGDIVIIETEHWNVTGVRRDGAQVAWELKLSRK